MALFAAGVVFAHLRAQTPAPTPQAPSPTAQLTGVRYATGQNVAPVFEGWEKNPDGSFSFVFGYLNRNYEEEPEIPVGSNRYQRSPSHASTYAWKSTGPSAGSAP